MSYTPSTRLPGQGTESPRARRGDIVRGIAAIVGVLALLVGLPLTLVLVVGNPFAGWNGLDALTSGLTAGMVFDVFVVVLWLAWFYFTVSVVVELFRWFHNKRVYGTGLGPGEGGPLARRMVASIMLLFSAATFAPSFGTLLEPGAEQATVAAEMEREEAMVEYMDHHIEQQRTAVGSAEVGDRVDDGRVVTYVVQSPEGRHYDTLWDIAERYLGDGMRYKEIFELNRDRVQADGTSLRDADLIYPGWTLRLPADAAGPGLQVHTPASVPGAAGDTAPEAPSAPGDTDAGAASGGGAAGGGAGTAGGAGGAGSGGSGSTEGATGGSTGDGTGLLGTGDPETVVQADLAGASAADPAAALLDVDAKTAQDVRHALGGGLLAAGLLLAIGARRGPHGEVADDRILRLAENGRLALDLDRALRYLALGCRESATPLPEVTMIMAGEANIVLHHTSGTGPTPPWPWRQVEDGSAWIVDQADIPEERIDTPAPYPALVNVATTRGYEILVDLEAAPGLVSVGGDDALAREVLMSMAVELTTNVWSDGIDVDLVGFGSDLSVLAPTRVRESTSLMDVLDDVAGGLDSTDSLLADLGVDGVLAGRTAQPVGADASVDPGAGVRIRPRIVFTSGAPDAEEAARIRELVGAARVPLAVVSLGHTPASRWKFVVTPAGDLSLEVFGLQGTARRITLDQLDQVSLLFRSADAARQKAAEEMAGVDPERVAARVLSHVVTYEDDPTDRTEPSAERLSVVAPETLRSALARSEEAAVRLLGQVEVTGPGPVPDDQKDVLTELVVAVALHREGVHPAVLKSLVWPRGVSEDVFDTALVQARQWLGHSPAGEDRLRIREDGRWELHDVENEWALLLDVAHSAFGIPEENQLFELLLDRARGEVLSAPDTGSYAWVAFHQARRDARVLVTTIALQAAQKAAGTGDVDGALWFLDRGVTAVPTAETMWRELLRLTHDHRPDDVTRVARRMMRTLTLFGVERREAQTDALVAQIAPSVSARLSA
ncbi:LysM peptidoglycan-binding domain-containing protein [Brevibacterium litoralis]|uniref:LysM peptidoglycan-binding domain-containing protein n=1 Tax=Brevibacterium litoralis TaxID=3138935 RepID=UPI0032EFD858